MELRQLEYFKTVVETGSISEAARRLHMSQPPLSFQMKKLEEEVGTLLFVRGHRNIALTEAGIILYTRAEQILAMSDAAVHEVERAGKYRTLYIGMTPSTIQIIGRYLKSFSRLHPEVRYQIRDGSTFQIKHLLENREIDAAVLRSPVPTDSVDVLKLGTDPMAAAIPVCLLDKGRRMDGADSRKELLEKKEKTKADSGIEPAQEKKAEKMEPSTTEHCAWQIPAISLQELAGLPLSVYRRYVDLLTASFRKENLAPDFFSVCDDARTTLLWAEEGVAAAVFAQSLLRNTCSLPDRGDLYTSSSRVPDRGRLYTSSCRVFRIDAPELQTDVLLVKEKNRLPNPLTDALWAFVEGMHTADFEDM